MTYLHYSVTLSGKKWFVIYGRPHQGIWKRVPDRSASRVGIGRPGSGVAVDARPGTSWKSLNLVALAQSRFVFNLDNSSTLRRSLGIRRGQSYTHCMPTAEPSKNPLLARVGQRIQDLREAKRMEPTDFAKAAGFSLSYLWRLEGGQQNITLATISRLALALGEPMSALLDGIDPDPATLEARPYVRKPKKAVSGGSGAKAAGA